MIPTQLKKSNRLSNLRENLDFNKTDLQRSYNFSFDSIKLRLFRNITVRIINVEHPYINFTNEGDYRGYISSATKPSEITITFLEDDKHIVNGAMNAWDVLKFDESTGIHYPKAVYEDIGYLYYFSKPRIGAVDIGGGIRTRSYIMKGLYPITREPVSLGYDINDVVKLTIPFNVDEIQPLHIMGEGV